MRRTPLLLITLTAFALSSAALANGDHGAHDDTPYGRPGDPKKVARTVTIEASEIAFNTGALTFKTGETVKFVLVNKGTQNHELTIGDAAMQHEHRGMMASMGGMSHAGMDKSMLGHAMHGNSVDTKPGETKILIWQFTKPGTFEFACNYPGHAELGMEGKISVR